MLQSVSVGDFTQALVACEDREIRRCVQSLSPLESLGGSVLWGKSSCSKTPAHLPRLLSPRYGVMEDNSDRVRPKGGRAVHAAYSALWHACDASHHQPDAPAQCVAGAWERRYRKWVFLPR